MNLGQQIRTIRESRKISLRKLAKEVGVSPSFISQVEQSKAQPSVDSLKKIAEVLGVNCSFLIGEEESSAVSAPVILSKNKFDEKKLHNIVLKKLVPENIENNMEPTFLNLAPGATTIEELSAETGEEFLLLLSGELEITLNGKVYHLHEGDNIYFNARVKHSFKNRSKNNTKLLWVKVS